MPDLDRGESRGSRVPAELFRATESTPASGLATALDDLDRAVRTFAERLEQGRRAIGRSRLDAAGAVAPPPAFAGRAATSDPERGTDRARADALIAGMLAATERETAAMRRSAETEIRNRRRQAEEDASRRVEDAQRLAARLVREREQRIAALSDGIVARAHALTAGMDDAEAVRARFDGFVRALSADPDAVIGSSLLADLRVELRRLQRAAELLGREQRRSGAERRAPVPAEPPPGAREYSYPAASDAGAAPVPLPRYREARPRPSRRFSGPAGPAGAA